MRRVTLKLSNRFVVIAFTTWSLFIKLGKERAAATQRRCLLRLLNRFLSLAWLQWTDMVKHSKLRGVMIRMAQRQLSMGWAKWVDMLVFYRKLLKFVLRVIKAGNTGLLLTAVHRWKQLLLEKAPKKTGEGLLGTRPRRQRLGHCECVYGLAGRRLTHCRCSREKHLTNRVLKLRADLDRSLDAGAAVSGATGGGARGAKGSLRQAGGSSQPVARSGSTRRHSQSVW